MWPALVDELVGYLEGEKMPKEAVQWFKRVRPSLSLSLSRRVLEADQQVKCPEPRLQHAGRQVEPRHRDRRHGRDRQGFPARRRRVQARCHPRLVHRVGASGEVAASGLGFEGADTFKPARCTPKQLQAYFLVADDMMDQSITRRGQSCWYRVVRPPPPPPASEIESNRIRADESLALRTGGWQENVGNIAINDAFMLEAAIYYLLKKHFRQEKYYVDLLELFHEVRLFSPART